MSSYVKNISKVVQILAVAAVASTATAQQVSKEKAEQQFTYGDAALTNLGVAIGEVGAALVLGNYYSAFTTATPFDMGPAARVLNDAEIDQIVRMVDRSPLAGFGLGEAGGGRLSLVYDEEQFLQSVGRKNYASLIQGAADQGGKAASESSERFLVGISPEGAGADEVRMRMTETAKAQFSSREINLRTLARGQSRPQAVKALLTELKANGVHMQSVQMRGFIPRMGGVAVGTLNIVLVGSAASNTSIAIGYGLDRVTRRANTDFMEDSCSGYDPEIGYVDCEAPGFLESLLNSSEATFYYFTLDEEQQQQESE